jgi:RND family efflux transporter MFP subunit
MNKSKIIWSVVAVIIVGVIAWRLAINKKTIDSRAEVKTTTAEIAVSVATVEIKTVDGNLKLVGVVGANRSVSIASEVAGKITGVNFKLGDYVRENTVLVQVDDELKQLEVEQAQLNYDKCREDYERYKTLRNGDAASEIQLRDMKFGFENARIQMDNARKQLSNTRIIAPFGGYITQRNVETGMLINIGMPVANLADVSELKIVLQVSESNIYQLRQGQKVNITASVFPGVVYGGKISNIGLQGDNAHTYPVEIVIPNSKDNPLKAGTFVNVEIVAEQTIDKLMIPRDALVNSVKEPSVYLVNGEIAQLVKISTGSNYGDYLEVRSGLKEGDKVVTGGQINLADGAKVIIK